MKHRMLSTGLMASLALGATAFAASAQEEMSEAAAERLAGYERTGETRTCIGLTRVRSIQPLDDRHFLVEMRNGDMFLNVVNGRCTSAASSHTYLQYSVPGSQLCRNEIVNVIDSGGSGHLAGSCGLGSFESLTPVQDGDSASR
ncbi:MAG: DUF6491 family protein [Caulobacterales bacterium]|uniref:DUF6491 family protein n=1 Tax=Glycocaulis sp. TaxID=1969725 RepID=UPI003FA10B39